MKELMKDIKDKIRPSGEYIQFYEKAISILGVERVRGFLKDIELDSKTSTIKSKAELFTYWLKEALPHQDKKKTNVFEPFQNIKQFVNELALISEKDQDIIIELPSRKNGIERPLLTSIYPFFTLSTNKDKSDIIPIKIKTREGEAEALLIRGKLSRNSEEKGILTVPESRVLDCILDIWKENNCPVSPIKFDNSEKPYMTGQVKFYLHTLLKRYGMTRTGPNQTWLINVLDKIRATPYCLAFPSEQGEAYHGFYLFSNLTVTGGKRNIQSVKREQVEVLLSLSPEITMQYYKRHYLPYSKECMTMRNELAYLIWQYLERIIEARGGVPDSVSTLKLIEKLHLPSASWHLYKSDRKRAFNKAILALKGMKTAKGNKVSITWKEDNGIDYDSFMVFGYDNMITPKQLTGGKPVIVAPTTKAPASYLAILNHTERAEIDAQVNAKFDKNAFFIRYSAEIQMQTKRAAAEEMAKLYYINKNKN